MDVPELAQARIPKNVKNGQMVYHGDDSTILAIFSDEYVENEFQTEKQARVIYDHFYQISLEYPGNNLASFKYRFRPDEVDTSQWPQRFPRQWDAFKNQKEQVPDGTPIELWPPLSKQRCLELKAMKIHTIEQVAGLTDMTGPNMGMDWRKLRDMAIATTKPNEATAQIAKVSSENQELKNKMEVMERQLAQLSQNKPQEISEDKPRRGRKPKTVETQAA